MNFAFPPSLTRHRSVSLILMFLLATTVVLGVSVVLFTGAAAGPESQPSRLVAQPNPDERARIAGAYGELPLSFERNLGQFDARAKFVSHGAGYTIFLTSDEAVLTLRTNASGDKGAKAKSSVTEGYRVLRMKLVGANADPQMVGLEELTGKLNYFLGNDPSQWTTDIPLYSQVKYQNVYNGIDLLYYGNQRQLEYDFQVAPGSDPQAIRIDFEGAERIKVDDKDGSLALYVPEGEVRLKRPVIYQTSDDGSRREIEGGYTVKGKAVQFRVGSFDPSKPLVIDPILSYATYLGSNSNEIGWGIAVDASGSAYVTGQAGSFSFPTTGVNFIPSDNSTGHAFVTKLDPSGSSLVYSTLIGGSAGEVGLGIAVDVSGSAYVTGRTNSNNFPTLNAIRSNEGNLIKSSNSGSSWALSNSGLGTLRVSRLVADPSSATVVYAVSRGLYKSTDSGATWTLLNTGVDLVNSLAIDPQTPTTLYAGTSGAPSPSVIKSTDGGATWFAANSGVGGSFVFGLGIDPQNPSTIYAGSSFEVFKSTNGGSSWTKASTGINFGNVHAFVFDPANSAIVYAAAGGSGGVFKTVNGGGNWVRSNTGMTATEVSALVMNPATSALYVSTTGAGVFKSINGADGWSPVNTGLTRTQVHSLAIDLATPTTLYAGTNGTGIFKSINGGDSWSQVHGGLTQPQVTALALSPAAPAMVYAGIETANSGSNFDSEAFVTKLNSAGNALVFSTYLGGGGNDEGDGIAVDSTGNVLVTGQTASTDFPLANPRQSTRQGATDAFVTKFAAGGTPLIYSTYLGGGNVEIGRSIAVDSSGNAYIAGDTSSADFPTTPGAFQTTFAGGPFNTDAFVTKIDPAGSAFAYSTYLGGNGLDGAFGIAVNAGGNAFVTGTTQSMNFPLLNPAQGTYGGIFLTKLNPAGSGLAYSTYFGGGNSEQGRGVALDSSDNAYVTGITSSANFPTSPGSLRSKSSVFKSTSGGAVWSNDNSGLTVGTVQDLAMNPLSLDLYAATVGGVYKSSNLGLTWVAANNGLSNLEIRVIAVDPQTPTTVYAGGGNSGGGLFKSTNGGATWSSANGNRNFTIIAAIAIDPNNPNIIYLSTASSCFKSTDGGSIWNQLIGNELFSVTSLAIDPQNTQIVYGTVNTSGGGVIKSVDGGATWASINNGLNASSNRIVIDPSNPAILYVGTNFGVFKSANGGNTWVNVLNTSFVSNLTIDPASPATVYATTFNGSAAGAIFRTTNGGANWGALGAGKILSAGRLLIDPANSANLFVIGNSSSIGNDGFVTRFNPAGGLVYSTLIGGQAFAIAADAAGSAYVTGFTQAQDLATPDSFQPINRGFDDAFVVKISNAFTISGLVTNGGGTPQSGVRLTLSGSKTATLFTGSDGSFVFNNLQPGGNYTVSATKTNSVFAPPSHSFANLNADQVANFTLSATATPFHTISGKITETNATPIVGVAVALSGSQTEFTVTDTEGNYSFSAPDGGSYTVTPSTLGFVFTPLNQSVNNLNANTVVNFTGTRQDFVVTNTNDHGAGSLREALNGANATQGVDRITFQISGSGVQTIRPTSPLPEATGPVTIDATTQPGFNGSPVIELDGSTVGISSSGLTISGGNSTVRGLVINRFLVSGITLKTAGGNRIEGNIIGLDPAGAVRRPNGNGITLDQSGSNIIGGTTAAQRNVISGNNSNGISFGTVGNQIKGNYIGTNASGTAALMNNDHGIILFFLGTLGEANQVGGTEPGAGNLISGNGRNGIEASQPGVVIQGNRIGTDATATSKIPNGIGVQVTHVAVVLGGTIPGARNIISGNGLGVSVNIFVANPSIILKGNYIGTDAAGTAKLGNGSGIMVRGTVTIGGLEPGAGNVISGNDGPGLQLESGGATLQGNLIGTDAIGLLPLGNATGISIQSSQNIIGGAQPGARNVISGNGVGLLVGGLTSSGPFATVVKGNYFGVDALGTGPLGNSSRAIELNQSSNTIIGGDQPGESNIIAFNAQGVAMSPSVLNTLVRGNSIFSNAGLGIDLDFDGAVATNDPADPDSGANRLQNFPTLASISAGSGTTNVKGSLNSVPATEFRIDFYTNQACDASGNGEGAVPFGFTTVTTDAAGNATFDLNLTGQLPPNRTVTATATDPSGNTSEFSPCDSSLTAGSIEFSAIDFNVLEDVGSAVIKVVRTGGSRGAMTVNYATGGGTAVAGSDYTSAAGVLTFAEGETQKTFIVPIADDGASESEETVQLSLSGFPDLESRGAVFKATLHIFDSNTPVTIAGRDLQVMEGDSGQKNAVISVALSAATGRTITVDYATVSGVGGATSGVDFLPMSGTLTFAPGVETREVLVPILGDTLDESNEGFAINLTNPVNASILHFPQIGILDDDAPPSLSITDVSTTESSGANAVFTVRLSAPSGRSVQLTFATSNGTATAPGDYAATTNFLSFSPGQTVREISVPILTDAVAEADETFFVNLANPLRATIADAQGVGTIIDSSASTAVVQFSSSAYAVNESNNQVQITVTRTGGTGAESVINYQTVAQAASDRFDFTPAIGTLRFAPGETSKTFAVLVTDDAFLEAPETLDLVLSNPVGAALGGPNVAALNITSNDTVNGPSPVREASFDTRFFVRQHYHDFLNREPDEAGLNFWANEIDSCGTAQCKELKKINVSAAFFLSIEFQETGYLAYRMYNSAYGETTSPNVAGTVPVIRLQEFLPDTQQIGQGVQVGIGNWQEQLEANKLAYTVGFVQRQRFLAAFPLSMSAEEFVAKLDQNTNGILSETEKSQLIALLSPAPADAQKRASVLRMIAEDSDLKQRELSRAFVLMQFYGYLRRNPDDPQDTDFRGWKFWLDKLNQFNGNFVSAEMVNAFLLSSEYRQRFGTQ